MGFKIDVSRVKAAVKAGAKVIYSGNRGDTRFFHMHIDEHWREREHIFRADLRVVMKDGSNGYGYAVVHKNVGWPGNDPKTFTCPKFYDTDTKKHECVLCAANALKNQDDVKAMMMDFVEIRDGVAIKKEFSVADVLKELDPEPRMVLAVVEPEFLGNMDAPEELRGIQMWFIEKRTVIKKVTNLFDNFPDDYFTDPATGCALRLTFDRSKPPIDMWDCFNFRQMAVPDEIVAKTPDAAQFISAVKPKADMELKLSQMFPGIF
jgi:hypothetical protein